MANNRILRCTTKPYTVQKLESLKELAEEILKYYSEHETRGERVYHSVPAERTIRLYTACDSGIEFKL